MVSLRPTLTLSLSRNVIFIFKRKIVFFNISQKRHLFNRYILCGFEIFSFEIFSFAERISPLSPTTPPKKDKLSSNKEEVTVLRNLSCTWEGMWARPLQWRQMTEAGTCLGIGGGWVSECLQKGIGVKSKGCALKWRQEGWIPWSKDQVIKGAGDWVPLALREWNQGLAPFAGSVSFPWFLLPTCSIVVASARAAEGREERKWRREYFSLGPPPEVSVTWSSQRGCRAHLLMEGRLLSGREDPGGWTGEPKYWGAIGNHGMTPTVGRWIGREGGYR